MRAEWRAAEREDCEALVAFLVCEEYRCLEGSEAALEVWLRGNAEFSRGEYLLVHHGDAARRENLVAQSGSPAARCDSPLSQRGNFAPQSPPCNAATPPVSSIDGMALLRRGGSCYCILPGDSADDVDLARKLRLLGTVRGLFGEKSDLCRLQRLVAADFVEARDYLLMARNPECGGMPEQFPHVGEASHIPFLRKPALHCATVVRGDLVIREAGREDWRALCALHGDYLSEELQLPVDASRDSVGRKACALLKTQRVLLAFMGGKPAGKANTNARGLTADQIGGVYVRPEYRGNGIAGAIVGLLADAICTGGRRCVLYVRPENAAARRVYEKLDFEVVGTYRSVYY